MRSIPHSRKIRRRVRLFVMVCAAACALYLAAYALRTPGSKSPSPMDTLLIGLLGFNTLVGLLAVRVLNKRPCCILGDDSISAFKYLRWVKISQNEIAAAKVAPAEITIVSHNGKTIRFEAASMDGPDWDALCTWVKAATPMDAVIVKAPGMTHSFKIALALVPFCLAISAAVVWPFMNAELKGMKGPATGLTGMDWVTQISEARDTAGHRSASSVPPPTKPSPAQAEQLEAICREYDAATDVLERGTAMRRLEHAIIATKGMTAESRACVRKYIDAEENGRAGKLNALYAIVVAEDRASLDWLIESAVKEKDPKMQKKLVRIMDMLDRQKARDLITAHVQADERCAPLKTFLTLIQEQKPGTTATDE